MLDGFNVRNPEPRKSWVQIARTGKFTSRRYGRFEISRGDLAQMLHNFNEVTPKSPTQIPIDYDHLSMSPQRPMDGRAAGWVEALELRDGGDTLWAEISWTPDAAKLIATKAYRFFSPSFEKSHMHKDGKNIGTTLLSGGITNHPFLEEMQPLALSDGVRPVAVLEETSMTTETISLASRGQRVRFSDNPDDTLELTPEERGQTLLVQSTVGSGDDQFAKLITEGGEPFGWFRTTCLRPADAPDKAENPPAGLTQPDVTPQAQAKKTIKEENAADAATLSHVATVDDPTPDITITRKSLSAIEQQAAAFAARVTGLATGRTPREAMHLAADQDAAGAEAYRLVGLGTDDAAVAPEAEASPVLALSAAQQQATSFSGLVTTLAAERKLNTKEAMQAAQALRPDLAHKYAESPE